ncbi:2-succinyl-6-hydroxy-2,4-cyclohexadiene-1-carboxylate synthase [Bacillus sp. OV322]|nr:2-succinyl-6-hydroxy-2,4-cyclohexadiene-1-carboxylate synthase [Bacillus sp. OV322]SFC59435.1 2-succinyl-6-hydroxy-2,4-cyclohexadiene-1-carboxylate synthase [Bacillus sp. OV322]
MRISCQDVEYHVEVAGEGEPLLLLHGFTGNLDSWKFLIPVLRSKCKLILVDIIGHGKTDSPEDSDRYEIKKAAGDLKEILDQLKAEKVSVLGYSMGGRLALSFAALYPERIDKLILESASPGLKEDMERTKRIMADKKLSQMILNEGLERFVDYWENIPLFTTQKSLPEDVQQEIRNQRLSNRAIGLANSLNGMGTGAQPSWWEKLGTFDFPVLLLAGELDEKFCRIAYSMKKHMKHCEVIIINGAGHAIHVEQEKKFGKIISEYL